MNYWNENDIQIKTYEVKADKRFYKHDIMGAIAHLTMLTEQGVVSKSDSDAIQKALTQIFYEITEEKLSLSGVTDAFKFIDDELTSRVGALAQKVNIARTNVERLLLDARMYAKEFASEILERLELLILSTINIAENQTTTIVNSEIFGQLSQPTTIAHVVCAHVESFIRDVELFKSAIAKASVLPMYCAYGTGIRLSVDKKRVASLLDFNEISQNTLDGISDLSFIHTLNFAITETAKHVTSFAKSLYGWLNSGILSLSSTTVSPVSYGKVTFNKISEIIAKTNACIAIQASANAMELSSMSLGGNTVEIINSTFEIQSAIEDILTTILLVIEEVAVNEQMAMKLANANYSTAVDCINYLVVKGETFATAYDIVGKICEYCEINNKRLDTITLDVYNQFSPLFDSDVIPAMRIKNAVRLRKNVGEPSDVSVRAEIRIIKRKLNKLLPEDEE